VIDGEDQNLAIQKLSTSVGGFVVGL
jgi:hypothetical protein